MNMEKEYGPNDNSVLYQESLLAEIERLKDLNFDLQKQVIPEMEAKNAELERKLANEETLRDHMNFIGYNKLKELEKKLEIAVSNMKEAASLIDREKPASASILIHEALAAINEN